MKKFLTVLLALSVVFTYTVGTAFAADKTYYASDYATELTAEKATQLGYLESDLNQIVNGYAYVDGYYNNYAKAAYEAAVDDVLKTFGELMDTVIREVVDAVPSTGTTTAPSTQYSKLTEVVYNNAGGSWTAKKFSEVLADKTLQGQIITDNKDVLDKTQAEIYLADLEAAIAAVDLTKYDAETLKYDEQGLEPTNPTMTAAAYVSYLIDQAEKAIDDAADKTDAEKMQAYSTALTTFESKLDDVKTIEEEDQDASDAYKTVEAALAGMKAYATGAFYETKKQDVPEKSDETAALDEFFKDSAFYTEKTSSKNATVFGVEVKDVTKVTRTEAIAINNAFFDAITESVDMARVYAGTDVTKVTALFNESDDSIYTATLKNSVLISDRYAEVVEYGDKLKAEYRLGFKVYDDAKVDEAVKAAEELVYADLGGTLKSAEDYLIAAANKIYDNTKGLANLEANESAYDKLMDAIDEAKDKFEGNIINYGTNATPEADKVFKEDYYAAAEGTKYTSIKNEYTAKLDAAQSYDEIEAILADAKTELSKLLTKENESDVAAARQQYINALAEYSDAQQALTDMDKYTKGQFEDVEDDGEALINAAITVDGVKDAYADAQALFADLKTDAQLEEMAEAVDTLVAALPYLADITADSKSQVDDARAAYDKYVATAGADETDFAVITKTTLKAAEEKVAQLQKEALEERLDAFADKLDKIPAGDASIDATLALEEEAQVLYDDIVAFNTYIEEYNENHVEDLTVTAIDSSNYDDLKDFLSANEGDVWYAQVNRVMLMIAKAVTNNATGAEMRTALEQYGELTERQQYAVIGDLGFSTIDLLKSKVISCVESLKITASSTAAAGSITVKWNVVGDYDAADGMRVYKSTKKNSGYGATPYFITKAGATYYKNTKELKKGTRYYYKVRAYVEIDGVKYYSDWSNKAYRIAK